MRAMDCKFNRFKEKNYFHYKKEGKEKIREQGKGKGNKSEKVITIIREKWEKKL